MEDIMTLSFPYRPMVNSTTHFFFFLIYEEPKFVYENEKGILNNFYIK